MLTSACIKNQHLTIIVVVAVAATTFLILHGIGQPGDFKDCALFGKARVWRSLTPFVSTRHAKTFRDGRPKMDVSGWQAGPRRA